MRLLTIIFFILCFTGNAHTSPKPKKLLLVVAMNTEANPIIATLHLKEQKDIFTPLPMRAFSGQYHHTQIMLVLNGIDPVNHVQNIGTEAATLSTYLGISHFHPDLVISVGTAGGVKENHSAINNIYISERIYFYDRRLPFEGYRQYGEGDYLAANLPSSATYGLKPGIICSGDSFDDSKIDFAIFLKKKCVAIDMEAAAVAWVSMLTHTPMFAIKGVTNFVTGDDAHSEYQKNLPKVTQELAEKIKRIL